MRLRLLLVVLLTLLLILQYQLWFGAGSLTRAWQLENALQVQIQENANLKERNATLEAEVQDLKTGMEAIEERVRTDLGMIKEGESFYQVVDDVDDGPDDEEDNDDEASQLDD
ncbi:MAG: cell division protein FtsB [Gammaproteobacteria bacterium]|nr:cell division protein FtsB [Gammaproteobacteria bacterium]